MVDVGLKYHVHYYKWTIAACLTSAHLMKQKLDSVWKLLLYMFPYFPTSLH